MNHRTFAVAGLLLACVAACRSDPPPGPDDENTPDPTNPDWALTSHGNVPPTYSAVFPDDSVYTLELTMTAQQWAGIRVNMTSLYGFDFGSGGAGSAGFPEEDPEYVDVGMRVNGTRWNHVGFRLKGNSTLSAAWRAGNYKLPFRLNIDRFEDEFPTIRNQRFYGFKELSFSPGRNDNSLIRERVAADIFRLAGVPAARTAFYRVFINFGEGPKYCGVYTAVEVIDDTMIASQFGEDRGNMYKPLSHFQFFLESQFEKKNNEDDADYSDVQAAIAALSSGTRQSNPALWRTNLEATFDADHFLRWLAVSNAIVNWDSYGTNAHNYYLYHHSSRGLVWIPWDHHETLTGAPGITGAPGGSAGGRDGLSLTMNEVNATWPLIRYLADDPAYFARYKSHLQMLLSTVLTEATLFPLFDRYHAMVAPHAIGPNGEQPGATHLQSASTFSSALGALKAHVQARRMLVATFVQ